MNENVSISLSAGVVGAGIISLDSLPAALSVRAVAIFLLGSASMSAIFWAMLENSDWMLRGEDLSEDETPRLVAVLAGIGGFLLFLWLML